jgi:hypothetical protein
VRLKKLFFFSVIFFCLPTAAFCQTDTIYTAQGKLSCKIIEISPSFISYKLPGYSESPLFVLNRHSISGYFLKSENTRSTEPLTANAFTGNLRKRTDIIARWNPFGLFKNCIAFSLEQRITRKYSLEVEAGVMRSNIITKYNPNIEFTDVKGKAAQYIGGYLRPSIKLRMPGNYRYKWLPTSYLRLDYLYCSHIFKEVTNFSVPFDVKPLNVTISSNSFLLCYGLELMNRRRIVLDAFFGTGFTFLNVMLYDTKQKTTAYVYDVYEYFQSQYRTAAPIRRVAANGLTYTGGFRIGYKFSDK